MQVDDQPIPASSSAESHLDDLASLLEQLETYPDNVALVKQQIALMTKIPMLPEVLDATMRLASLIMLSEGEFRYCHLAESRSMARIPRSAHSNGLFPINP
jgi:hypothetical protein